MKGYQVLTYYVINKYWRNMNNINSIQNMNNPQQIECGLQSYLMN